MQWRETIHHAQQREHLSIGCRGCIRAHEERSCRKCPAACVGRVERVHLLPVLDQAVRGRESRRSFRASTNTIRQSAGIGHLTATLTLPAGTGANPVELLERT